MPGAVLATRVGARGRRAHCELKTTGWSLPNATASGHVSIMTSSPELRASSCLTSRPMRLNTEKRTTHSGKLSRCIMLTASRIRCTLAASAAASALRERKWR